MRAPAGSGLLSLNDGVVAQLVEQEAAGRDGRQFLVETATAWPTAPADQESASLAFFLFGGGSGRAATEPEHSAGPTKGRTPEVG